MNQTTNKIINFYQKFLSPAKKYLAYLGFFKNANCVFYPTCSEYTKQAINKYGIVKGLRLSVWRVLRCHPWQKNHIDPLK
ncbi:MAG: membrane protein insertion efficiency factor YidD [Minisyncoccia bacterium]